MTSESRGSDMADGDFRNEVLRTLARIEAQVKATNGRVTRLEQEQEYRRGYEAAKEDTGDDRSRLIDRTVPAAVGVAVFVAGLLSAHYWPLPS